MSLRESLVCSICRAVMYEPVVVVPCFHSFCGGCISDWLDISLKCPLCKTAMKTLARNRQLNDIIESYLKDNTSDCRDVDEIAELKAKNKVYLIPLEINDEEEEEEEEFSDESATPACPLCCEISIEDLFTCETCRKQICVDCCPLRQPDEDLNIDDFRGHIFNDYEFALLKWNIDSEGLSFNDILKSSTRTGRLLDVNICKDCFAVFVDQTLLTWMQEFLVDHPSIRENCWWGIDCRTQYHNPDHAKKLNHICERTR